MGSVLPHVSTITKKNSETHNCYYSDWFGASYKHDLCINENICDHGFTKHKIILGPNCVNVKPEVILNSIDKNNGCYMVLLTLPHKSVKG